MILRHWPRQYFPKGNVVWWGKVNFFFFAVIHEPTCSTTGWTIKHPPCAVCAVTYSLNSSSVKFGIPILPDDLSGKVKVFWGGEISIELSVISPNDAVIFLFSFNHSFSEVGLNVKLSVQMKFWESTSKVDFTHQCCLPKIAIRTRNHVLGGCQRKCIK